MVRLPLQEERLMHRFYADPDRSTADLAVLSPEDARHASAVLRLKPGQHVEIIADSIRREAELLTVSPAETTARFLSTLPSTEPLLSVTLFQGIPKSDKMDLIVQKATELGARRIVPVLMARCVSRPDPKDLNRKRDRWQKIAREAGKQSGRCVIPEVCEPVSLHRLTALPFLPETNVVPWEEARSFGPLAFKAGHPAPSSLGILIGPEGGIEKEEIDFLKSAGFIPLTLGKRILRTETAGLAALASLMTLYGEME